MGQGKQRELSGNALWKPRRQARVGVDYGFEVCCCRFLVTTVRLSC